MEGIKIVLQNGMHLLTFNGEIIPGAGKTVVKQEVDQALAGVATVIIVFENVPLEK